MEERQRNEGCTGRIRAGEMLEKGGTNKIKV